jgi:chromosome segregation ATPase
MDGMFVWIVMFAGAAVALLGLFLVASERELKVKRREIETLVAKLEDTPQGFAQTQSVDTQGVQAELADLRSQNRSLQDELGRLTDELDQTRNTIGELRNSQQHSASSQIESQQLGAANERLTREVTELKSRLAASEARVQSSGSPGRDEQEGHARMQAEIDNLKSMLNESHTKIRDLESARQNLPDMNAITAAHSQERDNLQRRIAELEGRISSDQEKLAEHQTMRDRLAQAQSIQNSLRDEIRRHEEEIPRWQARVAAADESRQRLAALQAPCNELLSKQAALADRQRQLQEDLVAFARQIAASADASERSNSAAHADSMGNATANVSSHEALAKSPSSGNLSSVSRGQDAALESSANPAPGGSGRRYGMLGMLLFIAAVGGLGIHFFTSESEPPRVTAKPTQTSAPGGIAERAVAPRTQQAVVETQARPAPQHTAAQAKAVANDNAAPASVANQPAKTQTASLGPYQIVRSSRVYAAPSELSRYIGEIEPGVNVNVVNARDGWLEIHSKHGRPPGFIRREAAARLTGQN